MVLVEDVMSTDIVTEDVEESLEAVVGQLLAADVGSVVVVEDGNPTGLVTKTDVLEAAYESGEPLEALSVRPLCKEPLVMVTRDKTIQTVARQMQRQQVKKLPVVENLDVVGIVTLTDIVYHLSDIRTEARRLSGTQSDWESE
jgi:CBS domain-containing protein